MEEQKADEVQHRQDDQTTITRLQYPVIHHIPIPAVLLLAPGAIGRGRYRRCDDLEIWSLEGSNSGKFSFYPTVQ
jgi:hypothetical protein